MNFPLWVLQILLAFWNISGGMYALFNYDQLKSAWASALPKPFWVTLFVLQILFSVGLVLPGVIRGLTKLIGLSAVYLAVNSLLGCVLFAKYAGFPGMLWGVVPAILLAFVAYGRIALKPF